MFSGLDAAYYDKDVMATMATVAIMECVVHNAQDNLEGDCNLLADFHRQTGSRCVDVGTSSDAPGLDIAGDMRPAGAGTGADEFVP